MGHYTVAKEYGAGRLLRIDCRPDPDLEGCFIRDECFLLLFIAEGTAVFSLEGREQVAIAPCVICFDEHQDPLLVRSHGLSCWGVYFHPTFLNINLTFERLRSEGFDEIATVHDFFLLQPFLRHEKAIPLTDGYRLVMENGCRKLCRELEEQPDWYWSCRSRSYLMEMLIALERLYRYEQQSGGGGAVRDAILYMESHYDQEISLESLAAYCRLNRTTLSRAVRQETGMTPREYLLHHRMMVAKKHLAFTEMPIKEIARRCGFKTVQHFGRLFREREGLTPATYRAETVRRRREELQREDVVK